MDFSGLPACIWATGAKMLDSARLFSLELARAPPVRSVSPSWRSEEEEGLRAPSRPTVACTSEVTCLCTERARTAARHGWRKGGARREEEEKVAMTRIRYVFVRYKRGMSSCTHTHTREDTRRASQRNRPTSQPVSQPREHTQRHNSTHSLTHSLTQLRKSFFSPSSVL